MKIWIEKPYAQYDCLSLHWKEPEWDMQREVWQGPMYSSELYDSEALDLFHLKVLPDTDKHELFEIDLSGRPRVVQVWVPA